MIAYEHHIKSMTNLYQACFNQLTETVEEQGSMDLMGKACHNLRVAAERVLLACFSQ